MTIPVRLSHTLLDPYVSRTRTAVFGTFQESLVVTGGKSVLISILQQFLILSISKITEVSKLCDAHCIWKCSCSMTIRTLVIMGRTLTVVCVMLNWLC